MKISVTNDKPIYQWDTDRTVTVIGSATKVFWVDKNDQFLITRVVDGVAKIPNILLMKSGTLTCWVFNGTTDLAKTYTSFPVYSKPYPIDYVYTDTETVSIEEIIGDAITTEAIIKAAEVVRDIAEGIRNENEADRQDNENERLENEYYRNIAEEARAAAETARALFTAYNAVTAYIVGNKVSYNGSSYICIQNSTGNLPTNTTYWLCIAQAGEVLFTDLAERQITDNPPSDILRKHTKAVSGYLNVTAPNNASGGVEAILKGNTTNNLVTGTTSPETPTGLDATATYLLVHSTGANVTIDTADTATPVKLTGATSFTFEWATGAIALFKLLSSEASTAAATLALKYRYTTSGIKHVESQRLRSTDGTNTSICYFPSIGKRVPNGICDTIDQLTQKKIQNITKTVLNGSMFNNLYTELTNTYAVYSGVLIYDAVYLTYNSGMGICADGDFTLRDSTLSDIREICLHSDKRIYIRVEKTKINAMTGATTLDKFKAYLNTYPIELYYQISTPVITSLQLHGADKFKLYPNGTIYSEPTFSGYATSETTVITTAAMPIKSIRKVIKSSIINHQRVETDVTASVTITDSNTSITIAGFDNAAVYFYDVEYDGQYSANPEILLNAEVDGGIVTHDYAATATAWTLTANESRVKYFKCINAGGAANMIIVPIDGEPKTITNTSGQTITVKTAASTGITIANNKTAVVVYNGTDYIKISEV